MQTENVLIVLFAWFETAAAPIWSQSTDKLNDFMCSNCVFSHPIWAVCHWAHIFAIPKVLTKLVKFLFISSFFVCWTVSDETFPFRYACKKLYHDLQTYLFDLKSPFIHSVLFTQSVFVAGSSSPHAKNNNIKTLCNCCCFARMFATSSRKQNVPNVIDQTEYSAGGFFLVLAPKKWSK